jgi:hypothetical protein
MRRVMNNEIKSVNGSAVKLKVLSCMPWLTLVAMLVFGLTVSPSSLVAKHLAVLGAVHSGAVVTIALLLAIWFITCFTGDADATLGHAFVFAYAFTFASFALLVTPLILTEHQGGAAVRPPDGVLQLVSGCVKSDDSDKGDAVSRVTRCPDWAASAPIAASAPGGYENARRFPWLVSIGGVSVRQYVPLLDQPDFKPQVSFAIIEGGLAVPLFVIVLAFIGGAVSLSRRIPEYQRRSSPGYVPSVAAGATSAGTADQPQSALEARESVVFQIMQLVSAPFLAVATWYVVTPTTLAAAAGLAFGTGFASEPLLLMIRGMVDGLRPAVTLKSGAQPADGDKSDDDHDHGDDHGNVTDPTPDEELPPAQGGVEKAETPNA